MVDKSHPQYKEYESKFMEIWDRQSSEIDQIQPTGGKDGPAVGIRRKYAKEIRELQEEYSFLFTEE